MDKFAYGHRPPDLDGVRLGLGWLVGVRHLKSGAATESFWHSHEQMQIMHCFKGEFAYEFRDAPPAVLAAGQFIVIPAGMEHRHLRAIDPAGHRVELLVKKAASRATRYGVIPGATANRILAELVKRSCRPTPSTRELAYLFAELDSLAADPAAAASQERLSLARALASLVLIRCAADRTAPQAHRPDARIMDEAVAWLRSHATEHVRMDRLVAYMGYSRSRFFDLFRRHTGLTPADWLARHRVKLACAMLEGGRAPIASVARDCGFASTQYFVSAFRRQTGVTPAAWRKQNAAPQQRG